MGRSKDEPTILSVGTTRPDPNDAAAALPADPPTPVDSPEPKNVPQSQAQHVHRPSLGSVFGESERFLEREVIGSGGMATVIRAFDKDLHRDVAIKVLAEDWAASEPEIERFTEEARITGQLEHPYIVPVYEFGRDGRGSRFLCMKLVKGETLEDTLHWAGDSRLRPDMLADLLQVFIKVCDAVSFAHSRGIIHRDLKPSNVMISDFGQVYVMDWGVARVAPGSSRRREANLELGRPEGVEANPDPPGALIGTPCYMAPEQLMGRHEELDERTDVFALGAILYQVLTGQPPRLPNSLPSIMMRKGRVEILPPEQIASGIPGELSRIALKAMAHDPAGRHASVNDLKKEIEQFQRGAWHLPRAFFSAGAVIISEGEPGESAYIIVEGRCVAFRNEASGEVVLREMGPGEVFGETAVFSNKPRSASVKALTDVVVMVVTGDILSNALGLNFWMGSFVKALAERFREVDERLRQLEHDERKRSTAPK